MKILITNYSKPGGTEKMTLTIKEKTKEPQ
jgi:flavodoxin